MPVNFPDDFKLFKTTNPFKEARCGLGMTQYAICPLCEAPISSESDTAKTFRCCAADFRFDQNPSSEEIHAALIKKRNAAEMRERAKKGLKKATKKVIKNARKSSNKDADGLADKVEKFAVEGDKTSPEQDTNRVAERGDTEMTDKKKDDDCEHTCGAKVTIGQARCPECGEALDWSEYGE